MFFFRKMVQGQQKLLTPRHPQDVVVGRQSSFVDSCSAFQDLSESFKCLYKSVFDSSQGLLETVGS